MADSFTPTLNLTKPEINQSINTWGNKLNGDMDLIDQFAAETKAEQEDHEERLDAIEAKNQFFVPARGIIMWSGTLAEIPAGWALCNGSNGTPNLADRFILGAHPGRLPGNTGGAFSYAVATDAQGTHSHSGATAGHAITEAQMPSHQHGGGTDAQGHHDHALPLNTVNFGLAGNPAGMTAVSGLNGAIRTEAGGSHAHNIATDFRGGNQAHVHGIFADGNHAHNVTVPNVPPYYALAFIMKLPPA